MPYKIVGNSVIKKSTGKVVGKSKNPKKYLTMLNMIEAGVAVRKRSNKR